MDAHLDAWFDAQSDVIPLSACVLTHFTFHLFYQLQLYCFAVSLYLGFSPHMKVRNY